MFLKEHLNKTLQEISMVLGIPCEVALLFTRAVKYNRIAGGMTPENVEALLLQGAEVASKVGTCSRAVKAILPYKAP